MSDKAPHHNFGLALKKLELFLKEPISNERDMAGIIQAFEYTFEQCWKACQKIAALEGITAKSPKQSLEAAFQLSLIKQQDETVWLRMLEDRNLTSHTYNEKIAEEVVKRISITHSKLLRGCFDCMTNHSKRA